MREKYRAIYVQIKNGLDDTNHNFEQISGCCGQCLAQTNNVIFRYNFLVEYWWLWYFILQIKINISIIFVQLTQYQKKHKKNMQIKTGYS